MAQRRPGITGTVFDRVEKWGGLGLGVAGLAVGYSEQVLTDPEAEQQAAPAEAEAPLTLADLAAVAPGAVAGIWEHLQRLAFDAVARAEDAVNRRSSVALQTEVTARPLRFLHSWLADWDARFRTAQAERSQRASEFLTTAGPATLGELLSRVDLDAILAEVDLNAVVDRVDVEQVLDKVDINAVLNEAIRDLDTSGLIVQSTGAIASGTVDSIRTLPGAATRIAGRVVRRP